MKRIGTVALLMGLAFSFVLGQDYKGKVLLSVTTEDGSPLPGAVAQLTSPTFSRSFVSDSNGAIRFVGLEPDTYELRVSLTGFNTVVRPGVTVETGASVRISVPMSPATEVVEMVVTAETPLMDARKVGTSTVVTTDELYLLPQSRDPWSVLTTVPSIQSDRINIGGSESGQQSNFAGKGDDGGTASWVMDGVEFTDPAARGASQSYLDFASFSQIGVTTGGADASQRSSGARLNFVTKKGSNVHTGSMSLVWADRDFQSHNNENTFTLDGEPFLGNRIGETFEKSFELGGPIVKDRLWYWGAFNQNSIDTTTINGSSDKTTLENLSIKLHGDITNTTRFTAFYTQGDKIKNGRGAGVDRPQNTTWNQSGPTPIYKFEISQLVGDSTELTATYGRVDGQFALKPIGTSGQLGYDLDTGFWDNTTYFDYATERPVRQAEIKGNTFLSTNAMEHELQYGFKYYEATVGSTSRAGDDQLILYYYGSTGEADTVLLYREGNLITDLDANSAYVSDTMSWGNWTVTAGLRWDKQSGQNKASSTEGNRFNPEALPDLNFLGQDEPFSWSTVAPRIGATYNWGSDRQYLLRANASIYYDTLSTGYISYTNPAWYVTSYHIWNDLDGDLQLDEGELGDRIGGDADPDNPAAQTTINLIDPDLKPNKTTEIAFGFEYAINPEFTLAADFTHRKLDDDYHQRLFGISRSDYRLADEPIVGVNPFTGETYTIDYYVVTEAGGANNPNRGFIFENRDGYSEVYQGLELSATKRLSNRWMLRGNIVFQDWTRNVDESKLVDPNNYWDGRNEDGGTIGIQSAGSGNRSNVWSGGAKWQGNINGLYQLPWNLTVSGNLFFREGYAVPLGYRVGVTDDDGFFHRNATQDDPLSTTFAVASFDSYHYDDVYNLDLKLGKNFDLGTTKLELSCEVFNVFNEDTVLARNLRLDQSTASEPREILSPRIARFSARINF
ncbi:MAG: carboxypeptidase regulatory-like domain-containing protein [Acidobacteria bacterium]|nr:carboxypeptidase regulatory-like domain-containing protein [Acidobacteriota bacterium]MCB9396994.1 carboxypeptidase regulatory-like domain-containing protein [Acidobacteriota bacterium]